MKTILLSALLALGLNHSQASDAFLGDRKLQQDSYTPEQIKKCHFDWNGGDPKHAPLIPAYCDQIKGICFIPWNDPSPGPEIPDWCPLAQDIWAKGHPNNLDQSTRNYTAAEIGKCHFDKKRSTNGTGPELPVYCDDIENQCYLDGDYGPDPDPKGNAVPRFPTWCGPALKAWAKVNPKAL